VLSAVLHGCETWSLILRDNSLRVFECRVMRRIFEPKRNALIGGWRKLHNDEIHKFYSSPNIIRAKKSWRVKWAGYLDSIGERRNSCKVSVGEPVGKRSLRRCKRRWNDNIKIDV
jgi:hypothetical protein